MRSRRVRRRAKLSPLTVLGELLIVAGIAVFGYLVWQPWHTGVTVVADQIDRSAALSAEWQPDAGFDGEVPVADGHEPGEVFAVLHAPAFGSTFANVVAEGTDQASILDPADKGIGRYSNTQHFGEIGNVALAAHRSGPIITPFREVMSLRVGDPLFIETQDGWYTYRFRSVEYVLPSEVDVLNPFPRLEGAPGEDQILTLTTCHPKHAGSDERAIAYAVFEEFSPRVAGVPAELAEANPALVDDVGAA